MKQTMRFYLSFILILALTGCGNKKDNVSQYNVIWDTPSEDSFGSMPLGNGDIGLNVWFEKTGDLLFYISKTDAFDSGHKLPKLGRIRIKTEPAIPIEHFKQALNLDDASIRIESGDAAFKIWVDANHPVIRIEGNSKTPRAITVAMESLRPLQGAEQPLADKGTVGIVFDCQNDRLAWCYRNQSSDWAKNVEEQNTPEMIARIKDPILHRTSGCLLQADGFEKESPTVLKSKGTATSIDCSIKVVSSQPESLDEWLTEVSSPVESDWKSHCNYWESFWNRSYIHITSCGEGVFNMDQCRYTQFPQGSLAYEGHKEIDADKNARQISEKYALERFCEAIAGRGVVPPPFNGSIFTMDVPAGVAGFYEPVDHPASPDERDWSHLSFMWQNTRQPYLSMATRGDYDALRPGMQFIRDGLEICADRCKKHFGHDGAFIMEASWWHNVGVYSMDNVPPHLFYHHLASLELPVIMCEYYEHTGERDFLDDILLPCAEEFIKFYKNQFPKRDAKGIILMEGVGCAETYQGVTNPCTEIGGLKYLLTKLLSFDIGERRRNEWSELLNAMPDVPLRRIRGLDLLAVGEIYDPGRVICESPELYSVYPFRQVWLGEPRLLQNARQSFHVRTTSLDGTVDSESVETGGWQLTATQAAYLGLAREAARLVTINFNDQFIHWTDNLDPNAPFPQRPRARFPAFWERKMDYTPDNDHGATSINALQSMLLQSDGKKIFLLPAFPEEWDVSFKLCASFNTTVECEYRDGKVQSLKVSPESRRADIIDMSSPQQRIRTLVEMALTDHNYLFGLPPMLDAMPLPGKTTASWLSKYGYTLEGCKAGPWANSVFSGKTVFVHLLDFPENGVRLPAIPRKLLSSESITGNIQVKQDESGWLLTGSPDSLNTIVKLEFDGPVDDLAFALPSEGSHTAGEELVIQSDKDNYITTTVNLGEKKLVDRFEFTIDNPGYRRGHGRPFKLQVREPDGKWKTVYHGRIYGTICGKKIAPVNTDAIRLTVQAKEIKQLDIFYSYAIRHEAAE
jgi:hypothetical protein